MQAIDIFFYLKFTFSSIMEHAVFHNVHSPFPTLVPYIHEVVSSTLTRRSTGKFIEGATVGV